jgi:hypothetical protein
MIYRPGCRICASLELFLKLLCTEMDCSESKELPTVRWAPRISDWGLFKIPDLGPPPVITPNSGRASLGKKG